MSKTNMKPHVAKRESKRSLTSGVIIGAIMLVAALAAWPLYWWHHNASHHAHASSSKPDRAAVAVLGGKLEFRDLAAQSREFIGYSSSIQLTAQQEAIKREVLEAMPAACCKDSTAYTCCCKCNLSKTVWGLSNYVLTQHHATADQLRETVAAWKDFTSPSGYSGSSCYDGRCEMQFHNNGCGGMSESNLVL